MVVACSGLRPSTSHADRGFILTCTNTAAWHYRSPACSTPHHPRNPQPHPRPPDDEDGAPDPADDDRAGSERERKQRRLGARAARRGVTDRSVLQAGEALGPGPPARMPDKPMMELKAGCNVWYQAYVIKESQNEAKVRFPCEFAAGFGGGGVTSDGA